MQNFLRNLLLPLLLSIAGCSTMQPKLDPDVEHKKDLTFCVKDVACFPGTGVVEPKHQYKLEIAPRNEENIDRIVFSSCHRTLPFYMEQLPLVELPFLGIKIGKKRRGVQYDYIPTPGDKEDTGTCDLRIYALDFESEDHSWGILRIRNPKYNLPAMLYCNGDGGKTYKGVSVCDAKVGDFQWIEFNEPVNIKSKCDIPKRLDTGYYEIRVEKGNCPYLIKSLDEKRAHSLIVSGWETFTFQKR